MRATVLGLLHVVLGVLSTAFLVFVTRVFALPGVEGLLGIAAFLISAALFLAGVALLSGMKAAAFFNRLLVWSSLGFAVLCALHVVVDRGTDSLVVNAVDALVRFHHLDVVYPILTWVLVLRSPRVADFCRAKGGGAIAVLFAAAAAAGLAAFFLSTKADCKYAAPACGPIDPVHMPRLLVLTDIGNEVDDQQSLVRLLTYADEIDIEGLLATTSRWLRSEIRPELIVERLTAYRGPPRENLMRHTRKFFPTCDALRGLVKRCQPVYGMAAVGEGQDSEGSDWIIAAADRQDPRPLWVSVWGGTNCLAQALWRVRKDRTTEQALRFIKKLRVYAILDQDDSGPWIRENFADLFYVVSPTRTDLFGHLLDCRRAACMGISAEHFWRFRGHNGPRSSLVGDEWIRENVQENHGPLGTVYPTTVYASETDSPSFLNLTPNGLRSIQSPAFGGWGGRYERSRPCGEPRPIYTDSSDAVVVGPRPEMIPGDAPGTYASSQATIWRWREAYQNDFAARMDWAATADYAKANHPPVVRLAGDADLTVSAAESVYLDAAASTDPDGDSLRFRWFHYKEAGSYDGTVVIETPDSSKTRVTFADPKATGTAHLVLEVKDSGNPPLFHYARVVVTVVDKRNTP